MLLRTPVTRIPVRLEVPVSMSVRLARMTRRLDLVWVGVLGLELSCWLLFVAAIRATV